MAPPKVCLQNGKAHNHRRRTGAARASDCRSGTWAASDPSQESGGGTVSCSGPRAGARSGAEGAANSFGREAVADGRGRAGAGVTACTREAVGAA